LWGLNILFPKHIGMSQLNDLNLLFRVQGFLNQHIIASPITEEGLLIGIAVVAILIVLGIIFGVFDWISKSFSSLFKQFG